MKKVVLLVLCLNFFLSPGILGMDGVSRAREFRFWVVPCAVALTLKQIPDLFGVIMSSGVMQELKPTPRASEGQTIFAYNSAAALTNSVTALVSLPLLYVAGHSSASEMPLSRGPLHYGAAFGLSAGAGLASGFQVYAFGQTIFLNQELPQNNPVENSLTPLMITEGISSAISLFTAIAGLGNLVVIFCA